MLYKLMGKRIRERRKNMQLTQQALADQIDLSASFLGHIERGTRVLSVDTLVKLCTALRMCPNELLGMDYMEMTPQMPDRLRMFSQAVSQAVMDIARQHFDDGDAEEE
ncbi:MAG: helix-turn-helix transcriptional regulator [Clostridia bacterium]|nr:helix-turn-helix transcriptional regulator [Clostridia bacterium]